MIALRRILCLTVAGAAPFLLGACAPPQVVSPQVEPVAAEHRPLLRVVLNGERLQSGAPAVLRVAPRSVAGRCGDTAPMPNTLRAPLRIAPVPMPNACAARLSEEH